MFHKFGANEKCVSRLHSKETGESGQPHNGCEGSGAHKINPISNASFQYQNLRDVFFCFQQQICPNNSARIRIFIEVLAKSKIF